MTKRSKILFIVYFAILLIMVGVLVYSQFINKDNGFIAPKHVIKVIVVYLLALIKIPADKENSKVGSSSFYKKFYSDIIKDSFADDKKSEKELLKAVRYFNMGKNTKAIEILDSLLPRCRSNNEKYTVNLFKALSYSDVDESQQAIDIYENMISNGLGDSRVLSNLMNQYSAIGNSEKAFEVGKESIEINPNNHVAYHNLANLYFLDGNFDAAIEYENTCLRLNSKCVEALAQLYIIYSLIGDEQQAEIYMKKAIANGKSKKELLEALEYYEVEWDR